MRAYASNRSVYKLALVQVSSKYIKRSSVSYTHQLKLDTHLTYIYIYKSDHRRAQFNWE